LTRKPAKLTREYLLCKVGESPLLHPCIQHGDGRKATCPGEPVMGSGLAGCPHLAALVRWWGSGGGTPCGVTPVLPHQCEGRAVTGPNPGPISGAYTLPGVWGEAASLGWEPTEPWALYAPGTTRSTPLGCESANPQAWSRARPTPRGGPIRRAPGRDSCVRRSAQKATVSRL